MDNRDERVEQFNAQVASEEKRIDHKLKDKAPEPGQSVSVELSRSATKEVIDELIKIYSYKGWKVTYPSQSKSGPRTLAFEYSESQ